MRRKPNTPKWWRQEYGYETPEEEIMNSSLRRFILERSEDVSGISGTGTVAEGVEFTTGMIALNWLSHHRSVEIAESIKTVEQLHGHDGKTKVIFLDP